VGGVIFVLEDQQRIKLGRVDANEIYSWAGAKPAVPASFLHSELGTALRRFDEEQAKAENADAEQVEVEARMNDETQRELCRVLELLKNEPTLWNDDLARLRRAACPGAV